MYARHRGQLIFWVALLCAYIGVWRYLTSSTEGQPTFLMTTLLYFSYGCCGEVVKIDIMEFVVIFFFVLFILGISIATTVLAYRKGYNFVNWFFLSLFWGIVGLIILAYLNPLERDKGERDILVKVLWSIVFIPIMLFVMFFYNCMPKEKESRKNWQTEKATPKIELPDNCFFSF